MARSLYYSYCSKNQGFSLVELSIVLVIIGLLTGGILSGQSLIHAAELRSVTSEYQQYKTAVMTFQDKYLALPGDMKNATSFWGRADTGTFSGQCADPVENAGTGTQTCNGDGDGVVGIWCSGWSCGSTTYYQTFRLWQQLANAGLITGSFTGVHATGSISFAKTEENVPNSKFSNAGWQVENIDNVSASTDRFDGDYGNYFVLGRETSSNAPEDPIFTPEDAFYLDQKIDDGKSAQGNVVAFHYNSCKNATSSSDLNAEYDLLQPNVSCALFFRHAF